MTGTRHTPSSTAPTDSAGSRGGSVSATPTQHTGLADASPRTGKWSAQWQ
jgi:hypothetical protein